MEGKGLNNFTNPEVPITIIYGSHIKTNKKVSYSKHTRDHFIKTQNFYFPEKTESSIGDGTVNAYSAILPGLKWAYEFENYKDKNYKPVKLINYCGNY